MTDKIQEKLLPCPFCGGEAEYYGDNYGSHWCGCVNCCACTNEVNINTKEEAYTLWNTRTNAATAEARELIEELSEELSCFLFIQDCPALTKATKWMETTMDNRQKLLEILYKEYPILNEMKQTAKEHPESLIALMDIINNRCIAFLENRTTKHSQLISEMFYNYEHAFLLKNQSYKDVPRTVCDTLLHAIEEMGFPNTDYLNNFYTHIAKCCKSFGWSEDTHIRKQALSFIYRKLEDNNA